METIKLEQHKQANIFEKNPNVLIKPANIDAGVKDVCLIKRFIY